MFTGKNKLTGLTAKQIIDFSDDLYNDGIVQTAKKWGFKGTVKNGTGSQSGQVIENTQTISNLEFLKENLGINKYTKIQSLIKECLKEGYQVEITIPKQ